MIFYIGNAGIDCPVPGAVFDEYPIPMTYDTRGLNAKGIEALFKEFPDGRIDENGIFKGTRYEKMWVIDIMDLDQLADILRTTKLSFMVKYRSGAYPHFDFCVKE
jgi:hypothetical protein